MKSYFSIGIHHPKTETNVGSLWRSAHLLGASYVFTIGRGYRRQASDTMKTTNKIPLFHFEDIDDLVKHLPNGCQLVGVELDPRSKASDEFDHTRSACYLLGSEDTGLPQKVMDKCHHLVKLPGERSMNVAVAGSLVIYDRWRQMNHGRWTTFDAKLLGM